jgi:hypothetical protein
MPQPKKLEAAQRNTIDLSALISPCASKRYRRDRGPAIEAAVKTDRDSGLRSVLDCAPRFG